MRMRAAVVASTLLGSAVLLPAGADIPDHAAEAKITFATTVGERGASLSIMATPTTLKHGSSTVMSGRAAGAKLGTVVKLQRRVNGAWRSVAKRTISSTRAYSFKVTPPKGRPRYRAFKPRQLGQPAVASSSVRLTVRWRPTIAVEVRYHLDALNRSVTTVTGRAPALHGETLEVQYYLDPWVDQWRTLDRTVAVDSDGRFKTDFVGEARGTRFRLRAPASGARLAAVSPAWRIRLTPVPVTINTNGAVVHGLGVGRTNSHQITGQLIFAAQKGQRIGVAMGKYQPEGSLPSSLAVRAPDGHYVLSVAWNNVNGYTATGSFVAPMDGTYRIDVASCCAIVNSESIRVWVSTTKVVDVPASEIDDPSSSQPVSADWPGQAVEFRFDAGADDFIAVADPLTGWCEGVRKFIGPDGVRQASFERGWSDNPYRFTRGYLTEAAGTQILRYIPCTAAPLHPGALIQRAPTIEAEIDGPPFEMPELPYTWFSRAKFSAEAGTEIDIEGCERGDIQLIAPDDTALPQRWCDTWPLPQTGAYHLIWTDDQWPNPVTLEINTHHGN